MLASTTVMKRWTILAMALLCAAPACKDDKGGDGAETEEGSGSSGDSGLNHPDNDAGVVKLAKAAMKCEWKRDALAHDCEDYKAWNKSEDLDDGKNDATLLNMLEDGDKVVRFLAAKALQNNSTKWPSDKKAGEKVLAAAKKEKEKEISDLMGRVTGEIDVGKTGLDGDIKKLLADSKNQDVRKGIVSSVLFNNQTEGGFYDLLQKVAREDGNKDVRKAAAAAFWVGGSKRHDDTCKLWLELADDADTDIAGHSTYHASWWSHGGGCTEQWDALLDTIEKRGKAGKIQSTFTTSALGWLQQQPKASTAQKDRALKIAEMIAGTPGNSSSARGDALRKVGEYSPQANTVAAKFKDDKEFFVKSTAERILEGKVDKKQRK